MYGDYDQTYSLFDLLQILLGLFIIAIIITVIISVIIVVSMWRIFQKADRPGWAAIVPVYNCLVLSDITFGNMWLGIIPVVEIFTARSDLGALGVIISLTYLVYHCVLSIKLSNVFNKGIGFGIGMIFLPVVFYPILAFGSSSYCGIYASGGTFLSVGRSQEGYSNGYYTNNYNLPQQNYNSDSFYSGNTYNNGQQGNDQFYGQNNSGNGGYGYNQYGAVNNGDFYGQNSTASETETEANPFEQGNNYSQYGSVNDIDFYGQSNTASERNPYEQDNNLY